MVENNRWSKGHLEDKIMFYKYQMISLLGLKRKMVENFIIKGYSNHTTNSRFGYCDVSNILKKVWKWARTNMQNSPCMAKLLGT